MKSPLVEALRSASRQAGEPAPAADEQVPAGPEDHPEVGPKQVRLGELASDGDELSLIDATDALISREPTNDAEFGEEAGVTKETDDADFEQPESQPGVSRASVATITARPRWLTVERAGRYAPLLGVFCVAASMGAHFMFEEVGNGYQNAGLASLPAKIGSYGGDRIPEPQGPIQRFPLMEYGAGAKWPEPGPESASQADERTDAASDARRADSAGLAELDTASGYEVSTP